jgi:hypothetical protein
VTLDKLQIGRETISNADVGVIDTNDLDVDLLLGADFLRSHRVMFAMSQKKLYLPMSEATHLASGAASNPGCSRKPTPAMAMRR